MDITTLPFVIGVLGDFSGRPDEPLPVPRDRRFVEINTKNFDSVMRGITPQIYLRVPCTLVDDGSLLNINLRFTSIEDFAPERVLLQVPALCELSRELESLEAKLSVEDATLARNKLNTIVSTQLSEILQAPEFQHIEAIWRGLHDLVHRTDALSSVKVRIFNVSKDELRKDFEDAPDFDQTLLFRKVYSEEFDTFGGEPFNLLLGDYEFDRSPKDVLLLKRISSVAAVSHAPFVTAVGPKIFGLPSFSRLAGRKLPLARIFDPWSQPEYRPWLSFRDTEDARYVGLVLPKTLRIPSATGHSDCNAIYAVGGAVAAAVESESWPTAVLQEGLRVPVRADGESTKYSTVEIVDAERVKELRELGFIPIQTPTDDNEALTRLPSCSSRSMDLTHSIAVSRVVHQASSLVRSHLGIPKSEQEWWDVFYEWNSGLPNDLRMQSIEVTRESHQGHTLRANLQFDTQMIGSSLAVSIKI